jgi:hypothetical protein
MVQDRYAPRAGHLVIQRLAPELKRRLKICHIFSHAPLVMQTRVAPSLKLIPISCVCPVQCEDCAKPEADYAVILGLPPELGGGL